MLLDYIIGGDRALQLAQPFDIAFGDGARLLLSPNLLLQLRKFRQKPHGSLISMALAICLLEAQKGLGLHQILRQSRSRFEQRGGNSVLCRCHFYALTHSSLQFYTKRHNPTRWPSISYRQYLDRWSPILPAPW